MKRLANNLADTAEYVIGGSLFILVSAVTAAVMAIGFVAVTAYERFVH